MMTLAEVKRIIDLYLAHDQPDSSTAEREIRDWLRNMQIAHRVYAFSVRRNANVFAQTMIVIVDVQTTPTGSTHTLQFVESQWLSPNNTQKATPPAPPLNPEGANNYKREKEETPEEAFDRAMKGI